MEIQLQNLKYVTHPSIFVWLAFAFIWISGDTEYFYSTTIKNTSSSKK